MTAPFKTEEPSKSGCTFQVYKSRKGGDTLDKYGRKRSAADKLMGRLAKMKPEPRKPSAK